MREDPTNPKAYVERWPFHSLHPLLTELFVPSLEDAILKVLQTLTRPVETTNNARVDFYNKFKRAADEYDDNFVRKYGGDLDTTLIFVSFLPGLSFSFRY